MNLIQFLASDNFITVNKALIKKIGLIEAVIIGELASEYCYWSNKEKLEDNYFFSTVENIENNTGVSPYQQREAIKKLEDLQIIQTKKKGLPAKRYIKINEFNILSLINLTTSSSKIEALDVKKFNRNKNKEIKINNNNEELFTEFYELYPRKLNKKKSKEKYFKILKDGIKQEVIIKGLKSYIKYIETNNIETRFIKHPTTWLNNECWEDKYEELEEQKNEYNPYM